LTIKRLLTVGNAAGRAMSALHFQSLSDALLTEGEEVRVPPGEARL
jgi:hypothetical protein